MMNFIIFVVSIVFFSVFILNQYIKYKRFKYLNDLEIVYDKMEMYFMKRNIALSNNHIEFLKIFKNLVVNPTYLDIQILIVLHNFANQEEKLGENSHWFHETLKSLGYDFEELFKKFDYLVRQITKLSYYKPSFIWFLLSISIRDTIYKGARSIRTLWSDIKFITSNEEVISYSGMKFGQSI